METDINQIRNKLIDRVYLGLIIFLIPVLSASLFRITKTGWDWIYILQIFLASAVIMVYVLRSKISVNVKTHFFCIFFIIVSFSGTLKFGIAGGYIFCILSVIIGTLVFGKRVGYIYFFISITGLSIIGFLYGNKLVHSLVNLHKYNTHGLTWIILVLSILWLLIIVLFAINKFNNHFERNINALIQQSKEQEIAQQKIIESEGKYYSLVEHAGDAIFLVNNDKMIAEVNTSACNMLGYSREELLSMKIDDVYPTEELEKDPLQWDLLNIKKSLIRERKMLRKDGTELDAEISSKVLDGKGFLGIVRDITERKKAEAELIHYNRELKKTNAELDRFAYSTSHDLRAPLKTMLGLISITKSDMDADSNTQLERLEMLNKSVLKLDNFIEEILHYSRNKSIEIEKEEINLEEMIKEIKGSHKFMDIPHGINFRININSDERFVSDKARVSILLNNIILNAIKYADLSKGNSYVKIDVNSGRESAIIVVEDNGIGIADKDHEKIFEMFYRATKLSSGSGLGLYIVKETLEKLDGKINIASELDKGTKFTIEIPNQFISLN